MEERQRLLASLTTLRASKQPAELTHALGEICARYGLSHMTFLVVRIGGGSEICPYYCTTYAERWTELYVDKRYFEIDPVMDVMRWSLLPVDWSSLDRKPDEVRRFFEAAHAHDIGPNGLTIPVRGPKGERCLFSVASSLRNTGWARLRADSVHDLLVLSHYLHEKVLTVTRLREVGRYRDLSKRERQCLQLLATGSIFKQIAAILDISESSVRLYLRSARRKLGASTSRQAVAKAIFLELIDI